MLADQYQGIEDKYNALLGPPRKHEKEELVGSMHHYLILKGVSEQFYLNDFYIPKFILLFACQLSVTLIIYVTSSKYHKNK